MRIAGKRIQFLNKKTKTMLLADILILMQSNHGLYQTASGWIINGEVVDMAQCEWLFENGFTEHSPPPDDYEKYRLTEKGGNTDPKEIMFV